MQKKFTLLKVLAMIFQLSELYIGIGLVGSLFLFPYARSLVASKHGNVTFFVSNGSPNFFVSDDATDSSLVSNVVQWAAHENTEGALNYDKHPPIFSYSGYGNISFGPFGISGEGNRQALDRKNINAEAVQMDSLTGMFTLIRPANAGEILSAVQGPFLFSIFCTGLISITILELLSRMFKRVDAGEAFTPASIRRVQFIGILFIAAGILRPLTTWWLKREMADFAMHHVATRIFLHPSSESNMSAVTTGFVILALAELFRQGLRLKEETALTI